MKKPAILFSLLLGLLSTGAIGQSRNIIYLPGSRLILEKPQIEDSADQLIPVTNVVTTERLNEYTYHVQVKIQAGHNQKACLLDIPVALHLTDSGEVEKVKKRFHWLPNIKSEADQIISQHVFRSPCILLTLKENTVIFIPDVRSIKINSIAPYYMDLKFGENSIAIHYGLSSYAVVSHQY